MILKTLYVNGMIFTSNEEVPYADAMSVSLGAIDFVGNSGVMLAGLGLTGLNDPRISEYQVIDLKGKTVVPGFIDADIRPLLSDPDVSDLMRSASKFGEKILNLGTELSAKGIVAFGTEGNYGDKDAFELLMNLAAAGLNQSMALYYPAEFVKEHPEVVSDKQRLIRSRKAHIAGITLPPQNEITEELYDFAVDFAKENCLQISVKLTDEDPSAELIGNLMGYQNWIPEAQVPNIRVHRGFSDFNPFVKMKMDLTAESEARALGEGEEIYGLDEHVIGYTRHASDYTGFVNIGELKVGNSASFLILDRDMGRIPVAELDEVHPEVTIIDGRIAYKSEESDFELRNEKSPFVLSE